MGQPAQWQAEQRRPPRKRAEKNGAKGRIICYAGRQKNQTAEPPRSFSGKLKPCRKTRGAQAVFHMGAISETTARDGDLVWRTNVALSHDLWQWCARTQTRFVYASSAATYGAADRPELFSDDPARLDTLVPLNLYGWSKHVFDRQVIRATQTGGPCPPQWAGLKFFNVFGPNEYHKGKMISVVKTKYDELRAGGPRDGT